MRRRTYGDRSGVVEDSFGHVWNVELHMENVPKEELTRRAAEAAHRLMPVP